MKKVLQTAFNAFACAGKPFIRVFDRNMNELEKKSAERESHGEVESTRERLLNTSFAKAAMSLFVAAGFATGCHLANKAAHFNLDESKKTWTLLPSVPPPG